jgi:hypothetical protein
LAQLGARKAYTFQPTPLIGDHLLITTTWVFTFKDTVDPVFSAPLLKFKARLTAHGDLVDPARFNPDQLNAPTIDPDMVRVIMALFAADPMCQFTKSDIVGAYLNVLLKAHEPPIFIRTPIRCARGGVALVLRPLVHATGREQAPRRELPMAPPGRRGHAR